MVDLLDGLAANRLRRGPGPLQASAKARGLCLAQSLGVTFAWSVADDVDRVCATTGGRTASRAAIVFSALCFSSSCYLDHHVGRAEHVLDMSISADTMIEIALRAFTTFFATIGPVDVAAVYAVLTATVAPSHRRGMAIKGTLIASILILLFILFGEAALRLMGITLSAVRASGGILLLLMAIDMVFARPSGISSPTLAETSEAAEKLDISVFPLATPLIAGPGALGAAVLLSAEASGSILKQLLVITAFLTVMAITLALLLVAARLHAFLGVTGKNVISRIVGILLAGLAVQFIFDGIRGSGLVDPSLHSN
jgi:multiple antibiotic resistance protein